eukprot:COSAG02_NODE_121_length_35326_cov_25.450819_17_plen_846_part_00
MLVVVLFALLELPHAVDAASGLGILATGDWGGIGTPPYYNDVQMANANAMAGVMADPLTEVVPSLGLLLGDNFYNRGIDCLNDPEENCVSDSHSHRFERTFENVFSQPAFDEFPFYTVLGNHDHYGNATAQLEYSTQRMGSGRWHFPAKSVDELFYSLHKSFVDEAGVNVTVDIFMIDTVQWAGLNEECHQPLNTTDEELQLLWESPLTRPMAMSWAEAQDMCTRRVGSIALPMDACCIIEKYWDSVPVQNNVSAWGAANVGQNACDGQEASWPHLDNGLVCGQCRVLVNDFDGLFHGRCDEYCASIGRTCTGAWEELADTCAVESVQSCSEPIPGHTSDALCECGQSPPPPTPFPHCEDNDQFVIDHGWAPACFPYELNWCHSEDTARECCATCTEVSPWCAEHGLEEAAWSLRANLTSPLLTLLGTDCEAIVQAGQCEADLHDLFPLAGADRPVAGSIAMDVACPVSCGKCPRWNGVHRPPRATELQTREWTCDHIGQPSPALSTSPWTGSSYSLDFTCPETDDRIGGAAENAATWRHTEFAQHQREWLEAELGDSEADWKIVVGHYPVYSVAEHGPVQQLIEELKPLMETHGVAMYLDGHDHNAQHINDGSEVEYLVVGAGAPVDASTANEDKIPSGALKFYWARHTAEREACQTDPDCPFDSSIKDGSFAHLTFRSKDEVEVELISHREPRLSSFSQNSSTRTCVVWYCHLSPSHKRLYGVLCVIVLALDGEVLYTLTKPNPRYNRGASYTALDRTQPDAAQKVYVPFKPATTAPQFNSTSEANGLGWLIVVPLLTIAVGCFAFFKAGFCRQLVAKHPKGGASLMYEPSQNMQETMTDSAL